MRLPAVSPQRSPFPPRRSEREFETRGGLLTMDGPIAGVGAAVTREQVCFSRFPKRARSRTFRANVDAYAKPALGHHGGGGGRAMVPPHEARVVDCKGDVCRAGRFSACC